MQGYRNEDEVRPIPLQHTMAIDSRCSIRACPCQTTATELQTPRLRPRRYLLTSPEAYLTSLRLLQALLRVVFAGTSLSTILKATVVCGVWLLGSSVQVPSRWGPREHLEVLMQDHRARVLQTQMRNMTTKVPELRKTRTSSKPGSTPAARSVAHRLGALPEANGAHK